MRQPVHIGRELMRNYAPPMPEDFQSRMGQVIDALPRKGEKPMKKKLSFGLALALALTLLALGALAAALLTPKEAVEQQVLPMALENDDESFTAEEIDIILRLAEENGIDLPDYIYNYLSRGDMYKEEVIMAFAKSQFGPYPGQWTLEQQCWFEDVVVAIGFKDYNAMRVPGEGDLTYEEAYARAKGYIAEKGWLTDTTILDDRERYALWRSYQAIRDEESGEIQEPVWYMSFDAKTFDLPTYSVEMDKSGACIGIGRKAGLAEKLEKGEEMNFLMLYDEFTALYGGVPDWEMETFVAFAELMRQADVGGSRNGQAVVRTTYLVPPEDALPKERAMALAVEAAGGGDRRASGAYSMMDGNRAIWKVGVYSDRRVEDMVEMDLYTGEILKVYPTIQTDGAWQFYVPQSVWEAMPTPNPEGNG